MVPVRLLFGIASYPLYSSLIGLFSALKNTVCCEVHLAINYRQRRSLKSYKYMHVCEFRTLPEFLQALRRKISRWISYAAGMNCSH